MKCKRILFLAMVLLPFIIPTNIQAQVSITFSPTPKVCLYDEVAFLITIAETSKTKFNPSGGSESFNIQLPDGFQFVYGPQTWEDIPTPSTDLQGGLYSNNNTQEIDFSFTSVNNANGTDQIQIYVLVKCVSNLNTTVNLIVNNGTLYNSPAKFSIPITVNLPKLNLSLGDTQNIYCPKTNIEFNVKDDNHCSADTIKLWGIKGGNPILLGQEVSICSGLISFFTDLIDSSFTEIYATTSYNGVLANKSNSLHYGTQFSIISPKLFPFYKTQDR